MRSVRTLAVLALALATALALPARADDGGDGGDGGSKKPKHKLTNSDSYLEVEAIYTSILDGDRPVGMLMLGIGLDVPDAKLRGEADHAMPVLRDAFVRNMMSFTTTAVRSDRQPDVSVIANRLQAVADRALGRKGAKVLLAQVAMRITK
jgi:flagellar basal body-associated protein FliL